MYYSLAQDEISFLSMILKKEIKTHLVFDCLSKFTFGRGITQPINESYSYLYHTCVKKSIEYAQRSLSGLETRTIISSHHEFVK